MDHLLPTTAAAVRDLLAAVDRAFAVIGADTPGWPDPHPDGEVDDEEYSRYTDPGKYRILARRVEAWAEVLAERGIATTTVAPLVAGEEKPGWLRGRRRADQIERVYRVVPRAPGGHELLCGVVIIDGEPLGLDVGVRPAGSPDEPGRCITSIPYCGCDACDDGSAMLVDELDRCFLALAQSDPAMSP
ncbi:DUF6226 family protein [Nocardioides sp. zg-DK7169]|uniref:DUF6226 family protein n=1 Tax=Nocardioides sp. zg-DK7169 TaxID=2736600 RepID=UPI001552C2F7|nr:DUF6226 family protein [Nocardioides sp. zg-DK7169]NPC96186.1 hypothetical protein [Nocardioides sp. zg-DK7169]